MSPLPSSQVGFWIAAGAFCAIFFAVCLAFPIVARRFSRQREELRREHERWALVLQANHEGIFDADLRGGPVFYSPRWLAQLGYLPGELPPTNETWTERVHPDDRERLNKEVADYLNRRTPALATEYRLRHRDGHWCWIQVRAQAVWDEDGRAVRLVGSNADITKRKQMEFELRASEARLSTFLDHNPAHTFIKDEDGRMLFMNRSMCKLFQVEPGAWLGKTDAEIWPPDVAAQLRSNDLAALASETSVEFRETIPQADGSLCRFLTTKFVFREASGRKALGGFSLDMTEHLQAEQALRSSEARYHELFERNPLPAWIYRTDNFKIVEASDSAVAHYGWTRAELLGMTMAQIRLPEEFEAMEEDIKRQFPLRLRSGPWRHRRKDGSVIWVELAGVDLSSAGAPLRLVLVNDVTARIESEQAIKRAYDRLESLVEQRTAQLSESELNWRALVEAVPQVVWATGPAGERDYMSPRACEYTGLGLDQLQGGAWLAAVHPADRQRSAAAWRASLASGAPYHSEFRLRSKDGEYRWFKSIGRPMRDASGRIVRWIGTATDVEDQKRSEEILEAAVARRTLELAEARDRAEAATRVKSQFLAAMSHEIRTPMNGVIGMTNLLFDTPLTSEQRCYLDTIRSSGEALLTVINDILDLSKIEAGRLDLERTQFDLSTLIEEAMELVGAQAVGKNLALSSYIDRSVPLDLVGDPVRLRQVVLNLLANAVKFTAEGSVTLSVTREASQNPLTVLRFAVKDTGIGLTPAQQEGLFQAFQQGEASTSRRYGGTGLGLAISKSLVEMMGGSIGVHSQLEEGSTFWFNVCLEEAPAFADARCFAGKQVAFVSQYDRTASQIRSHLEGVGLRVSLYRHIPRMKYSRCDLFLVDSSALPQTPDTARLIAGCAAPVVVLGSLADFKFPLPENGKIAAFVEKPARRLPLLRVLQAVLEGALPVPQAAPSVAQAPPPGERPRVLLADDNKVNQLVARLLLQKLHCQVDVVDNGLEACLAAERRPYDLILMDCQMPTMGGFEATQRIRNLENGARRTPIVALTAGVLAEERERCYAAGMDDFLSKPVSPKELAAALRRWLPARTPVPTEGAA